MVQQTSINLGLGKRGYSITIGAGLLDDHDFITSLVSNLTPSKIIVITNAKVQQLYIEKLNALSTTYPLLTCAIDDGEQYKSLETLKQIYDFLLSNHCGRDSIICALGGGVVGDIAGFAAATYQRGIDYIQIPTTLLSQVDSSVGGKTAVNHRLGKNMIGAFYQPKAVIIDTNTLTSLPSRELSAGLAEIIKYALIQDKAFFHWLEANIHSLRNKDTHTLEHAIATSCRHKAALVKADELEHGNRALLNLGHSFGHAIEKHTHYTSWLHGEAVSAGIVCAARVSIHAGYMPAHTLTPIIRLLEQAGLPTEPPHDLNWKTMVSLLQLDKKNRNNKLRLVLMRDIGESFITDKVQADDLLTMLTR